MINQLTIRGLDDEVERKVREIARRDGVSLNQAVLRLLRKSAGLAVGATDPDVIGHALDGFMGTWSEADAREFAGVVKDLERVDESFWT